MHLTGPRGRRLGKNGAPGTQVFRLEYTDRRHWRLTLLENPNVPEAVGSVDELDGNRLVGYDAKLKERRVSELPAEEAVLYSPDRWLTPGRVRALERRPEWTATSGEQGRATLRRDVTAPDGRREREEITFRPVDGIPVRHVETNNGVEIRRLEVTELQVGRR